MPVINIYIDTEEFIRLNLNYKSHIFRRLVALCQTGEVKIHLPDITVDEIEAHIKKRVAEARTAIRRARKDKSVRLLDNLGDERLGIVFDGINVEDTSNALIKQFREFMEDAKVNVIPVEGVSIKAIFDKYHSELPPFKEGNKKHEFPDAFAVEAVREWSKKNNAKIYVISGDEGVRDSCGDGSLIALSKLEEFLDIFASKELLYQFAYSQYERHKEEIIKRIKQEMSALGLWVYEPDGDVVSNYIESVSLGKKYLIEVEGIHAIFEVGAYIGYSAEVEYQRFINSGMYFPITETVYRTRLVQAEVGLELYPEDEGSAIEYVSVSDAPLIVFDDPNFEGEEET
jgi:hypothetical protein